MSKNVKQSSPKTAALASAAMRDKSASKTERSIAASALAQSGTKRETGKAMEGYRPWLSPGVGPGGGGATQPTGCSVHELQPRSGIDRM